VLGGTEVMRRVVGVVGQSLVLLVRTLFDSTW
jgi:hypothetical protein